MLTSLMLKQVECIATTVLWIITVTWFTYPLLLSHPVYWLHLKQWTVSDVDEVWSWFVIPLCVQKDKSVGKGSEFSKIGKSANISETHCYPSMYSRWVEIPLSLPSSRSQTDKFTYMISTISQSQTHDSSWNSSFL